MTATAFLARLRRSTSGSTVIEFGLLAPVMLTMMLGVLHVGLAMQAYNSLRGASTDVIRYAVTNYQSSSKLTNAQIQSHAISAATTAPYLLDSNKLSTTVITATTQRVSGATELTLTYTYTISTLLSIIGLPDVSITVTRPIFVT